MRLDDFDPNINVEDQRGQSFGGFGGGGGGGGLIIGLLAMVFSRFGCLGVAIAVGLLFLFGGGLQMVNLGGGGQVGGPAVTQQRQAGETASQSCTIDTASREACNAFSSAEKTWERYFAAHNERFERPKLVFYAGGGRSACGAAEAAMGPFYCPGDEGIYLDTSFFQELTSRFGASGDFARDYVIAHEFGHHIQNLLGLTRGNSAGDNAQSVKIELQADCFAGVWAAMNKDRLDPGDVEEGLRAASAIGDDTLQKETQGTVVPDSFTHGTSAQRVKWLRRGVETGDPNQCDTSQGI